MNTTEVITAVTGAISTITDVLTFIRTQAQSADLDRLHEAIKQRDKVIRHIAAAKVSPGSRVTITGLSPKFLNGLTGTVRSINRTVANVDLDRSSKITLAAMDRSKKFWFYYSEENPYAMQVPLTCCVPS